MSTIAFALLLSLLNPPPPPSHLRVNIVFQGLPMEPRLEASGYVPRKFIAAEPLLEHGMSLALGYADAMSMARALTR